MEKFNNVPRTDKDKQQMMFGCELKDLIESKPSFVSNNMYAMMILSDAQAEIEIGNSERARVYINRAKYFIVEEDNKNYGQES